jgi:hypothetical protein
MTTKLAAGIIALLWTTSARSQTQFPWPITPFDESHQITGNFAEFRDTGSADHFHNGTDIPKADGSPVYPVKDGIVTSIGSTSSQGNNAFVRVQNVAYVHIRPATSLSIGDSVFASETILGTILPGLGHVHFTNGFVGSEKNSMLIQSGLTPLDDPWPPIIRYVRFYANNTTSQFPDNRLSGLVDIAVKVDEQNGPPSSNTARRNNGTYTIGYKILSDDSSTVVFEPPNDGLRFQFDTKPSNTHVHRVFFDRLSSTQNHVYIVTNDVTRDNFWNTTALPKGRYVVMVFTEDTRQNADTAYVAVETIESDLLPPAQPVLTFVQETEGGMKISWLPNSEEDLLGYRLFFSFDNDVWTLFRDERVLALDAAEYSVTSLINSDIYFRLTAVDAAPLPNESPHSDVYGLSNGSFDGKVLIVDGFDRTLGGSWSEPNHHFAFTHGTAIVANGFSFDTAPNEAVTDSLVDLKSYEAVFWILGDESTGDETFSLAEQLIVADYLEGGGSFFVSGSETAWDLDQDNQSGSTLEDDRFLHTYLKADFIADDSGLRAVIGVAETIFEDMSFEFGVTPYLEDAPDVIVPVGKNAQANLRYTDGRDAGLQFAGSFGTAATSGKLVYLAFPFETITGEDVRKEVMGRVFSFFFGVTSVESENPNMLPTEFALAQNYPNPFNPETTIEYHVPVAATVTLAIYNTLGQRVRTLVNALSAAGSYIITWHGENDSNQSVASGVYLVRMQAEPPGSRTAPRFEQVRTMLLLR